MDRQTRIDLATSFVVTAAPSVGWTVVQSNRSRSSLSSYIRLERDGAEVVVRISDHRSKRSTWDRERGAGFFQIVCGNIAKLIQLPGYLAERYQLHRAAASPA